MTHFPDLWILRHGETTWNVEDRLQGRLDSPLTDRGKAQARAQGLILRGLDMPQTITVRVSPLGRARETADLALTGLDWPVTLDPDLVEVELGDWQGRTVDDIRASWPGIDFERDRHLWKFDGPGCERLPDLTARVRRVLARLTGPTVLITHGVTSRVLRTQVLGWRAECLSGLPGGQGVVHHIARGQARILLSGAQKPHQHQHHRPD